MLAQLSPRLRVKEAANLSTLDPTLAQAYAKTKQKYIAHFPDGNRPYLVCSYRSNEEQAVNYAKGRTTPGPIVTFRKPGKSKHNRNPAQAFDIGFIDDHGELDYSEHQFANFYELLHEDFPTVIWGGHFKNLKDLPHFEL